VRVLIRRPQAYSFLEEHAAGEGGAWRGTVEGVQLDDGALLPLPGIYVLDPAVGLRRRVGLKGEDALRELRSALAQ